MLGTQFLFILSSVSFHFSSLVFLLLTRNTHSNTSKTPPNSTLITEKGFHHAGEAAAPHLSARTLLWREVVEDRKGRPSSRESGCDTVQSKHPQQQQSMPACGGAQCMSCSYLSAGSQSTRCTTQEMNNTETKTTVQS